jgi:hypothetical protein
MHFRKVQFAWNAFAVPVLILLATVARWQPPRVDLRSEAPRDQPEHVPLTFDDAFARKKLQSEILSRRELKAPKGSADDGLHFSDRKPSSDPRAQNVNLLILITQYGPRRAQVTRPDLLGTPARRVRPGCFFLPKSRVPMSDAGSAAARLAMPREDAGTAG